MTQVFFFLNCNQNFGNIQTITVSECCLLKMLPYILVGKYINILALEMASPGNQHCANCIDTLAFHIKLSSCCILQQLLTALLQQSTTEKIIKIN